MSRLRCLWEEFVYMQSVFTWVGTQGWTEGREGGWSELQSVLTSATVDCKITTLGKPLKKAHQSHAWTCGSVRRDWESVSLGGKRETVWSVAALVGSLLLSGENRELCSCAVVCPIFPSIIRQPCPRRVRIKTAAWSDGRGGCLSRMHKWQEFVRRPGAHDLCVGRGGGGWRVFPWVTQSQMSLWDAMKLCFVQTLPCKFQGLLYSIKSGLGHFPLGECCDSIHIHV